jgi:hypothetical protein
MLKFMPSSCENYYFYLKFEMFNGYFNNFAKAWKGKVWATVETETVKIQILRIRFLRYFESNFSVYNEKLGGAATVFLEREISGDNPVLCC